jgi:DNA modification methylase
MALASYETFVRSKSVEVEPVGVDYQDDLNPALFDWQADVVRWAVKRGKAALFLDTGLGKTLCQLEWARIVHELTGGDILILAPLAVTRQTEREAKKFNIQCPVTVCRKQADVRPGINITNYEMLKHFDQSAFVGVVLDESGCLKAYMGKRKREIIESFQGTPWKLACTATPSPNDHMELLNHAAFLDVMQSHEALAIWFINEQSAGAYRLKRHAQADFWRWVSSWAIALSKPSDLGYDDGDFELPPLHIEHHVAETDPTVGCADGELFRFGKMNATSYHREKRISSPGRADIVARLVENNAHEGPVVVWCETDYDASAVMKRVDHAIEVAGRHTRTHKETTALMFADGELPVLVSKGAIFGWGMNFQACHTVVINGMSFSYELFYQVVRRSWRFGQTHPVTVHIVTGDGEKDILATVQRKEGFHDDLKSSMATAMVEAHHRNTDRRYTVDYDRDERTGTDWRLLNGDAVDLIKDVPDDSVGHIIFSPPFSSLYIYSDSYRDMGNCSDDAQFFEHFDYLIPELFRVTMPGRLCAVHCKDLVDYKGRDGRAGLRDFPGAIIRHMERGGWKYHSKTTIWNDPVTEMQRTKAHGLLWKQIRKDSSFSRMGLADYLVVFRKWCKDEDDERKMIPVTHTKEEFPLPMWQRYASPVWMDINKTDVLNVKICRAEQDEKHLCPLQFGVIERSLTIWSNPGDLVLSPFAGVGSEGVVSLQMGRRFLGFELKREYFEQSARNLGEANSQMSLFDE